MMLLHCGGFQVKEGSVRQADIRTDLEQCTQYHVMSDEFSRP